MALLAPLFLWGVWRVVGLLAPDTGLRLPLAVALSTSGLLQAFAGHVEVTALQLTGAVWWWSTILTPMRTRRQAIVSCVVWVLVVLTHRLALVLFPVLMWRALGPAWPDDDRRARATLAGAGVLGTAVAVAAAAWIGGESQLGKDALEFLAGARTAGAGIVAPLDFLSLTLILAPLAALSVWFVACGSGGATLRNPRLLLPLLAGIALLPVVVQVRPSGLGPYRDWDLGALGGLCLQVAAAAGLGLLPAARRRVSLMWLLPTLTLITGAWLGVHADEDATIKRAMRLVMNGSSMGAFQRAQVFLLLGSFAAEQQETRDAATFYTLSYNLAPTPMRGLLATSYWIRVRQPDSAARVIDRIRDRGSLDSTQLDALRRLDGAVRSMRAPPRSDSVPPPR
jgi:hypothetical protein